MAETSLVDRQATSLQLVECEYGHDHGHVDGHVDDDDDDDDGDDGDDGVNGFHR